jgi:hypothetical protein
MTTRDQLKRLGISEDRLKNLGMGAPSTTAPAAAAEPPNAFRAAWDAHNATANAAKPIALPSAQGALDAARVYAQYRDGNCIERAYLRQHHGAAVELGRRVTLIDSPEKPPGPPPEAA